MKIDRSLVRGCRTAFVVLGLTGLSAGIARAADVTRPEAVAELRAARSGGDVALSWDAVVLDVGGNAETVAQYKVYRGELPTFVPDKVGGTNLVGTTASTTFTDPGGAGGADLYCYLVSAVDAAGNESDTKLPLVAAPPVLDGFWTGNSIVLDWTDAEPAVEVVSYRVYYGRGSRQYESVVDVGASTTHTLTGLQSYVNWYAAVTAVDGNGNETALSNEHVDSPNGSVALRVHNADELCWGAADCTPADPSKIQRNDGWQLLVPAQFPEGDWVSVTVTLTLDSRLCTPPAQGTVTKCGSGNPCVSPPCNGGYNPCGDPWDRLAHLFLVLDDCVAGGGSCITQNNLELIRAVTPFGTDAVPPNGTGVVPSRKLTLDVTPFAPLLTGTKHVGVEIVHFVQKGWWVTVDFLFTENPNLASPEPPADGIEIVGFGNAPLPTKQVTIPPQATSVKARLFTTGHGGTTFCDGGPNDGNPCSGGAQCPGGVCNPCDEFCHRTNRLYANGTPIWQYVPWRTDCSPGGTGCTSWNACGYPSCTFPRAGWCPGYVACHHNAPCDNDLDLTVDLPAGGTYDLDYDITPQNGTWPISLALYWYE